jgi:hypothetical protein
MQEERNPEQDEGVEGRFLRSDQPEDEAEAHRFVQRGQEGEEAEDGQEKDVEGHRLISHSEETDDDEVEAHSMGRLQLPEDPNTRF